MSIDGGVQPIEAFGLPELLTVLVVGSPIPSHPSTEIISATVDSLNLLGIDHRTRVVLAHDGVPPGADSELVANYAAYLANLRESCESRPNTLVTVNPRWGHLSGNIRNALQEVTTPYVLICQHDFPFIRGLELARVIAGMAGTPRIQHVRFNKNANTPVVWDCDPPSRAQFYTEEVIATPLGELRLTRTIGWSDNNHLCRVDYYRNIILPLVGERRIFPEHAANLAASHRVHDVLGTYIFGGIGDPPVLEHRDGRRSELIPTGHGDSTSLLGRQYQLNRTRVAVAVDRVKYKLRIRRIRNSLRQCAP